MSIQLESSQKVVISLPIFTKMFKLLFVVLALVTTECASQEQDGPYRGKFIGSINTYHHQVSGDVYAVDEWTLLLVNFNYDGTGDDTFFWAGDAVRPGPQGFIVPDQHGKTNILERYINQEVRLTLPEGKRVSRLKWFCVYDIDSQNAFGDVYVPDEFEPPAPRLLPALSGDGVSSRPLRVLTASTVLIPELRYDGRGEEVYFWTGVGPQPSCKGMKIPDEYGYLEPLAAYAGEDVQLSLAGGLSVFDVSWLALFDRAACRSLAAVLLPDGLNVPPDASPLHPYQSKMPQCLQLHRDYQVSWEVFGPQVTFELAAQIAADEYMAWGVSGSALGSRMQGADVAVAHYSEAARQAHVHDYNVSAQAPCVTVLDRREGVCRDDQLGGVNSYQLFMSRREDSLTVVTFRRNLKPDEPMDREWSTEAAQFVVWAVGRLDHAAEPAFHRLYPKRDLLLNLTRDAALNDCFRFTVAARGAAPAWETAQLFDPALRVFRFTLGPSGGARGVAGRGPGPLHAPAPLAWYVNGQLAPHLQLRRGLRYTFQVLGGNDPHSATEYHPLVVTAERAGGLERLSEAAQRAVPVLAGVHYTRRGRLSPTAAGPLCVGWAAGADRRRADAFASFRAFNRSLSWRCAPGAPAELLVAPNSSWPDLVYYHSFTHSGMGGRIYIVDRHKRSLGRGAAAAPSVSLAPLAPLAAAVALSLAHPARALP